MNKFLLKSYMAKYGDTQLSLSNAMGFSLSRFNAKINERNNAVFTQSEIAFIIERYHLSNKIELWKFFLLI